MTYSPPRRHPAPIGRRPRLAVLFLLLAVGSLPAAVSAFQPPVLGLGALLFPVRGRRIGGVADLAAPPDRRAALEEASDFFVDAFWTGKVGGGAGQLTDQQRRRLAAAQRAEFAKRYGGLKVRQNAADLLLCRDGSGQLAACAGVEVDRIPHDCLTGPTLTRAPLMSNLAVGRRFRRRGLAEALVRAVEDRVRRDWGADECYLYVEERNAGAVRLYRKLGYRELWRDPYAETLLPTADGDLRSARTTIVCMRKTLRVAAPPGLFAWGK